ncbi:unnamed protein product [Brachionus calyciflorus]|uniref:Phosphatidylinositol-glycan-specific phospholipase D n=1 Tax=Brachionus calyciflorus TaxID=104777 RepID=A0A813MA65_9BILA|nr:unnamed protein product [Brachionus calyciflorus]
MLLFLSILFVNLFYYTLPCGITTHIEIAHRAASHYDYLIEDQLSAKELIKKYQSAFQAGNPYPDSFYPSICKKGILADVSEDTHWTPFLNATINYIQKTYKKPYNEDAQRLIVFTLGYISHQMADVTWHSLGVAQGFLSAMGYVNFHGSFSNAHSVGDFGGDVVNQFELNTNYIGELSEWYVPYDDLYKIYFDLYGQEKINKTEIIECSSLLFLGRLGEQIAVSLLYADYFKKSAFLADRLNDYFLGGLDDMATWTQLTWNKFFHMLENGVETCKLDHNVMYIECNKQNNNRGLVKNNVYNKSIEPHYEIEKYSLDKTYFTTEINKKGVFIKPTKKFTQRIESTFKQSFDLESNKKESNSSYFIKNDYASLGWSLESGDLNKDGSDDLLIGAPVYSEVNSYQNGLVYGILSNNKTSNIPFANLNLETESSFKIFPPSDAVNSRFGHSIAILDLNLDGFKDIVISAPSYSLENIKYEGKIYIYLGDETNTYVKPWGTISCKKFQYCNLGWKLSTGHVNDDNELDLIISSPYASTCNSQCGFVSVLLSKSNLNPEIDVTELDYTVFGHMEYEWFGFSAKSKHGYLIVGAPESRICYESNCQVSNDDKQSIGRIYLYKYPKQEPIMVLNGEVEFGQFGYDFDLSIQSNSLIIAVSSVSENSKLQNGTSFELNRAGVVRLFQIDEKNLDFKFLSILKSDRPYSSFGSKVEFLRLKEHEEKYLLVSSQLRSESIVLIDFIQEGAVYVFEGGKGLIQNLTDQCGLIDLHPCPSKHAKLILTTSQKRSRFGFDFSMLKNKNNNRISLAVSAIHADNQESRLSGQIKIFQI